MRVRLGQFRWKTEAVPFIIRFFHLPKHMFDNASAKWSLGGSCEVYSGQSFCFGTDLGKCFWNGGSPAWQWRRKLLDGHIIHPVSHQPYTIVLFLQKRDCLIFIPPCQRVHQWPFAVLWQFLHQHPQSAQMQVIWTSWSGIHTTFRAKSELPQAH